MRNEALLPDDFSTATRRQICRKATRYTDSIHAKRNY